MTLGKLAMACGGGGVGVASLEGEPHPLLMDQMWGTGHRSRVPGGAGLREGWWVILSGVRVGWGELWERVSILFEH